MNQATSYLAIGRQHRTNPFDQSEEPQQVRAIIRWHSPEHCSAEGLRVNFEFDDWVFIVLSIYAA